MERLEMIDKIYEVIADGYYDSYSDDDTIFPVMIWDVLDYIEINRLVDEDIIWAILNKWKEKRKPIEIQSNNCVEYIFNLINKE